jgi:hypothetical protein
MIRGITRLRRWRIKTVGVDKLLNLSCSFIFSRGLTMVGMIALLKHHCREMTVFVGGGTYEEK